MGSPVSPIVANLYMECFEQKDLSTATHPPRMWLRYVYDIFVIQKEDHKQNFLEHINNADPALKFTVEDNKEDGAIPFLDTIVKPEPDCTVYITVYRKPSSLSAKYSVINTLTGPKWYVICLSFSKMKWITSRRNSCTVSTPNGP